MTTNNGHNIFLNEILRLSIPVGICFIILFVLIIVYAMEKKFSFFTPGYLGRSVHVHDDGLCGDECRLDADGIFLLYDLLP